MTPRLLGSVKPGMGSSLPRVEPRARSSWGRVDPRARSSWAMSMLHPEYPIEQAVHSSDLHVQTRLLLEIWRGSTYADTGAMLIADPKALRVLARSERALDEPVETLRQAYGDALTVQPPSVRYAHGAPVLEPYMMLLLCGPESQLRMLLQDLARRRGSVTRLDRRSGVFILEAEAPLGSLLGYDDWLDERTTGRTDMSQWLSRYRPIDDDPYAA